MSSLRWSPSLRNQIVQYVTADRELKLLRDREYRLGFKVTTNFAFMRVISHEERVDTMIVRSCGLLVSVRRDFNRISVLWQVLKPPRTRVAIFDLMVSRLSSFGSKTLQHPIEDISAYARRCERLRHLSSKQQELIFNRLMRNWLAYKDDFVLIFGMKIKKWQTARLVYVDPISRSEILIKYFVSPGQLSRWHRDVLRQVRRETLKGRSWIYTNDYMPTMRRRCVTAGLRLRVYGPPPGRPVYPYRRRVTAPWMWQSPPRSPSFSVSAIAITRRTFAIRKQELVLPNELEFMRALTQRSRLFRDEVDVALWRAKRENDRLRVTQARKTAWSYRGRRTKLGDAVFAPEDAAWERLDQDEDPDALPP